MREIKFRGKCIQSGNWINGFYFHVEDDNPKGTHQIVEHTTHHQHNVRKVVHVVDPETVGQYTGLKDANGAEIYEGDILEFDLKEWGGSDNIHLVTWDQKEATWCFGGGCQYSDMQFRKLIGNVHENPNLLTNE